MFYTDKGYLVKPINEFSAEEVRDFYNAELIPQFEFSGIDGDNGELLEQCLKRCFELLLGE